MENLDEIRGYFFGVLLGDGHITYSERALRSRAEEGNKQGPHLHLKVCDYEMIERWRNCLTVLVGRELAICRMKPPSPKHRLQYIIRTYNPALVDECEAVTKHKSVIPDEILLGSEAKKKAFVLGLMDSEGWINCKLNSIGQNDLTLGFGCGDPWFDDFVKIIHGLGIKTSKVYIRPAKPKKNGEMGRKLHLIRIDIQDYVNAGLSFTIKRKADRLAFCSHILNDYMRDYPRYADYYAVDDIV